MVFNNIIECIMSLPDIAVALDNNDENYVKNFVLALNDFDFTEKPDDISFIKNLNQILIAKIKNNSASQFLVNNLYLKIDSDYLKMLIDNLKWAYEQKVLYGIEYNKKEDQEKQILMLLEKIEAKEFITKIPSKLSELLTFSIINQLSENVIQTIFIYLQSENVEVNNE